MGTRPEKPVEEFEFHEIPTWEKYFNRKIIWRYERLKDTCFPFDFQSFFSSYFLLKKLKPDVVHLHRVNYISFAPVLSAKLLKIPVVASLYDYWNICPNLILVDRERKEHCKSFHGPRCISCYRASGNKNLDNFGYAFRRAGFDVFLKKIDAFHVLSNSSRNILRRYGIPEKKIRVIPIPFLGDLTAEEKLPVESNLMLFVGTIEFRKGLEVVVKALPVVINRFPDAKLVVIGGITEQEYYERIRLFIAKNNLEKNVEFKGKLAFEETKEYFKKAEIVVIAEQWENMSPVALTEAMIFAKPVVAGNAGGLPELIEHGKTGMLARYNDPLDFAEKIIYLLENKHESKNMAMLANEKAKAVLDEKSIFLKFTRLYESLII
jgi:glycosyltransferase involved in cell wall biosynthesis